ncbi:hypothetical protein ES703_123990 [subsurface metagenome]
MSVERILISISLMKVPVMAINIFSLGYKVVSLYPIALNKSKV